MREEVLSVPTLFDPLKVGDLVLPNRVVMAPLTRLRGTAEHKPTELMPKYYAQRASAGLIVSAGTVSHLRPKKEFETPRELAAEEIPEIVAAYMRGAIYAKVAGFDGVELHGANGYLLDQYLQSGSNKRTDKYGGSVDNRARLMLEVTDAVAEVRGTGRVGMHLAPRGAIHGMSDANPAE